MAAGGDLVSVAGAGAAHHAGRESIREHLTAARHDEQHGF